ncbi:MAG: PepSY-associated TM helix domain-containing protein [Bacteroidales bacterium]
MKPGKDEKGIVNVGKKDIAKTYKKLHKWPGLIIAFVLLNFGISGIVLNHRGFFSSLDVKRSVLPRVYRYANWNNAALKGDLVVAPDSILVFGNIGIWVTDSAFEAYRPLNEGFGKGVDRRKTYDLHRMANGDLYAATHFGLYAFSPDRQSWVPFHLVSDNQRFVALESVGDTLYALNRSHLFTGRSDGVNTTFVRHQLPAPPGYEDRVGLFETIWQLHSGEAFGGIGKVFVDLLALVTLFLSITGILYFFFPGWMKRRKKRERPVQSLARANRWSLRWHNHFGAWVFVFLIFLYFTGMFLRPPLLIPIANARVGPLKFSNLDQDNPWFDRCRDLLWDGEKQYFLLATSEGIHELDPTLSHVVPLPSQPPVSVMGITVLVPFHHGVYVVGSFSGLFLWDPAQGRVLNFYTGQPYEGRSAGRPIGDVQVTGILQDHLGRPYCIDYNQGVQALWPNAPDFPTMPAEVVEASGMSLWNVALEFHTGRIFQSVLGPFYILIVPLAGLTGITVVLSGYLLWRKRFRKKKLEKN